MVIEMVIVLVGCSMSGGWAYEIAKPGCADECGGVKIPFPFGIGDSGCYFNDVNFTSTYKIICNNSMNPAIYIPLIDGSVYGPREVLSIDLNDHTLRASSAIAYECYTKQSEVVPSTASKSSYGVETMFPFNISATRNMFVAVGCDTTALVTDNFFDGPIDDSTGCITSCTFIEGVTNGSCSGQGCCQTSMINTMFHPALYVSSKYNHTGVIDFNPCGYSFVGEIGSYNFSTANLTATAEDLDKLRFPVVYDWHLALSNICSDANNTPNICGPNTRFECVQVLNLVGQTYSGYRCHCLEGYAGNQYLPQGCQDINECKGERLNDCQRLDYCVNKDGGYDCRCPDGQHGNGTTTSPCIPSPGDTKLVLGLSIGMATMVVLILLYGAYKLLKRRKERQERKHNFKKNGGLLLQQQMSANEGAIERTKIFRKSELEKATDNFNDSRVLGRGGQGAVYKGMLADGAIVAIKKSNKVGEAQLGQFINEMVILSQINHRNVVKVFGCCLETKVPLLVYEFVPNGTLYQHIHHPSEDFHLTWKIRFQIALDCARAIAYLHSSCSAPIFHRDIKSSNILLDEKYKAKVSDFGTSKTIPNDKTHITTFVQGTFGYLDPEFFRSRQFSEKSDVYSFGVVLLELMTSKKAIYTDTSNEPKGLAHLVETHPTQLHGLLDAQVLQPCSEEEIETITKLIRRCLSLNGKQRPTMREVAMTLEMIKSQHDEEANLTNEKGEVGTEGIDDQMGITVEEPSDDTWTDNDTSNSMDLQSSYVI